MWSMMRFLPPRYVHTLLHVFLISAAGSEVARWLSAQVCAESNSCSTSSQYLTTPRQYSNNALLRWPLRDGPLGRGGGTHGRQGAQIVQGAALEPILALGHHRQGRHDIARAEDVNVRGRMRR